MPPDTASRALAVVCERPGRVGRDDTGAKAGRDERMQIRDAAASCGLRVALLAHSRDFGEPVLAEYRFDGRVLAGRP